MAALIARVVTDESPSAWQTGWSNKWPAGTKSNRFGLLVAG